MYFSLSGHLATVTIYVYHCMVLNFHTVGKRRTIVRYALLSVSDPLCHHMFRQQQLLCCWPDSAIVCSWLSGVTQLSGVSYSQSVNPQKHGVFFHQGGKLPCGALCGHGDSPSIYPLMTVPVRRLVIIPSFTSIACTLRKEFASRQKWLYENIDRDNECIHNIYIYVY